MGCSDVSKLPTYAHKTGIIIFDAVKGFIGGGMSCGRTGPDHDTETTFQFKIGASYYDEHVDVLIDIPDVEPERLIAWHDWDKTNILERQKLLLTVDGKKMPFTTALAFIAIHLGDAKRRWEAKQTNNDYAGDIGLSSGGVPNL